MSQSLDNLSYMDVTFDSSQRTSGSTDAPNFHASLANVVGGCVLSVSVPYSFYVIDRLCNEFLMKPPSDDDSETPEPDYITFSLWPGSYGIADLEGGMREALADGEYNDNTSWGCFHKFGRLVLYNSGASFDADHPFYLKVASETLAKILGFEANVEYEANFGQLYRDGVLLNGGNSLQYIMAPYTLQLSPVSLNLHSSFLSGWFSGSSKAPTIDDDTLLKIPISGNFSSFINYQGTGVMMSLDSRQNLERLDFYLSLPDRNEYSALSLFPDSPQQLTNKLPLNGQPFQVTLRLWVDTGLKMK